MERDSSQSNETTQQTSKWTADKLADALINRYKFSASLEHHKNIGAKVVREIREDVNQLLFELRQALTPDEIDSAIDTVLQTAPQGTDIDKEYGGAMLGIARIMVEFNFIKGLEKLGTEVTTRVKKIHGDLVNNRGTDRLFAPDRAIAEIFAASKAHSLNESQMLEALDWCDKLAGSHKDVPADFQRATRILKSGGLEALKAAYQSQLPET